MWPQTFGRFVLVSLSVVMLQTGMTTGEQQANNVGFVHPIATDTFPVNHSTTAEQQQPAEEDVASTAPSVETVAQPVKPQFQVPVTLPFVMQRPQKPSPANNKPSSYLRPIIMVDPITQDEPVQPIRQTKPWYAAPQEEDLSSPPPGVAVTLPFRIKPSSYLRPVFVVDEMNDAEDEQPVVQQQTKPSYYFPTRNAAGTLPFDLRNAVKSKPLSYLRPVMLTDADEVATPEGDYLYADLTSPISGTVQPNNAPAIPNFSVQQQTVKAMKPASYLRPWFVDDYVTPVRATKPHWKEVAAMDEDSNDGGYYPPLLVYRAGSPAAMKNPNNARPYRRPIAAVSFALF